MRPGTRSAALVVAALVAIASSQATAASLTYTYNGPVLSGAPPYHGDQLTASVVFDSTDILPLLGTGGTVLLPDVQSFSYVSVGSNLTIDSGNSSFASMSYTFDTALDIVGWAISIEANLGLGSPTLPEHISTQSNGVLVGQDDTFPNSSLWFLTGPWASSSPQIGSWTTPALVPEPATLGLFITGIFSWWMCGALLRIAATNGRSA